MVAVPVVVAPLGGVEDAGALAVPVVVVVAGVGAAPVAPSVGDAPEPDAAVPPGADGDVVLVVAALETGTVNGGDAVVSVAGEPLAPQPTSARATTAIASNTLRPRRDGRAVGMRRRVRFRAAPCAARSAGSR